ncbi:MAG: site-2 protease family protein [Candidatus Harrisonbacteria bacterium]|nr:site-2 protease family protein [Candidatus Harrisonbacteria bacterium]
MSLVLVPLVLAIVMASIILHEVAHGLAALMFGDDTAKEAGRLTLNPIVHIDLIGSIFLPVVCLLMGAPMIGWAKPVPVDFNRLPSRFADLCVSLAGIAVNFTLAVGAGLLIRTSPHWLVWIFGSDVSQGQMYALLGPLMLVAQINLVLGVFNLMPVPPLDGWRIWGVWLPYDWRMFIEMKAMWFMIALFILLPYLPVFWLVNLLYTLLIGL